MGRITLPIGGFYLLSKRLPKRHSALILMNEFKNLILAGSLNVALMGDTHSPTQSRCTTFCPPPLLCTINAHTSRHMPACPFPPLQGHGPWSKSSPDGLTHSNTHTLGMSISGFETALPISLRHSRHGKSEWSRD